MTTTIKHLARLLRIGLTLGRYRVLLPLEQQRTLRPFTWVLGLLPPPETSERIGERLARACERLGPSFIKLGQTLSTRPDIVGAEIAEDLALLRDNLPPASSAYAIATIEKELGRSIDELFSLFNETPVAAASIAQVHKATTKQGKTVAVKILRPDIEKAFAKDIAFFQWMARLIERFMPSYQRLKPIEVVAMFAESVTLEMDLRFEAAAASELKENCEKDPHFYIPEIDWQRTAQRVMTIEWVDGIPIHDRNALLEQGHDLADITNKLAVGFFNQAYRDGFFHADMHPGNLFVNTKGHIVPVDFGIMGRLNQADRLYVAQILQGFLSRNYKQVAEIHVLAGYVPADTNVELFAQACRSIGEPIIGLPANEISIAKLLAQLFKITEDFAMETQPQLLLLQKTMVLVEGIGTTLYPDVNMWQLAEPWIKEWAISHLGPEARLYNGAKEASRFILHLPTTLMAFTTFIEQSAREGIRLHPDTVEELAKKCNKKKRWWDRGTKV